MSNQPQSPPQQQPQEPSQSQSQEQAQQQAQQRLPPQNAGRVKPQFNLNLVQVVDAGCGILQQAFFKQPRIKAKALFKELKHGRAVALGGLNVQRRTPGEGGKELPQGAENDEETAQSKGEKLNIPLRLKLDKSEFRGVLNYPVFEAALNAMLMRILQHLREKKGLNILTDAEGTHLIHLPGVIQVDGQFNVMVMAIEPEKKRGMAFHLMFIDPDQYEALRQA